MRFFLSILGFLSLVSAAHAQQVVTPCIPVTTNGVTVCTPVGTAANPINVVSP